MQHQSARHALVAVTALVTLALAGCASLESAKMALPEPLAQQAAEPVQGIGAGRQGSFSIGGLQGSFSRGNDRLSLFELVSFDRASTRYSLQRADGSQVQAACRGRQIGASLGVLNANPRPFNLECQWSGALSAQLNLAAPSWVPGSRAERSGSFVAGGVTLELRSVHKVQGSPLQLEAPIGYLISHQGRPVGAIELNGSTPRLWRPGSGDAQLHEPVTLAALALALVWDPAQLGN